MVGTSILQLLSSATTAVEKYLNKFLSFELHLYTMHRVNIQNLFLYFLWYAQRPFPKFINVESCFGPFLSRSLLSVLVCTCIFEQIRYPQSVQARSFDGINHQLPSATLTPH